MRRSLAAALALVMAGTILAAPAAAPKEEAWMAKCKNLKIYGLSLGMTPSQVRNVFLKAPRSTLLPWHETTAYASQFRFDYGTSFGALGAPLQKFLDIGFAPVTTNATKKAEMRVWYDNPYGNSYPMQENHNPASGTIEDLPYISHTVRFHEWVVYTNNAFMSEKKLMVKDRANVKAFFNSRHRVVAIEVDIFDVRDKDQEKAFKYLQENYNKNLSKSDLYFMTFDILQAPGVILQSKWVTNFDAKSNPGLPQSSRRWTARNLYYHEEEYLKALEEKALKDPLLELL